MNRVVASPGAEVDLVMLSENLETCDAVHSPDR